MEEDCAAFGISLDAFGGPAEPFALLLENVEIVNAFLTVQSQMTQRGLRYEGVRAGLAMARIRCTAELFAGLQIMEAAVVEAWAERDG